ncbi:MULTISPECIES: helix-turn-helix domain-containing protein [Microbacterium]|uniref:AraC family transcriptional regulator n=1 Tax=Microbacterium wangchenii TaxID=2541726 RepID=A0ABX5ST74_9MICO|nr:MULTISPECIES: helix-turn-helix domain-containing protein [Microbacterium]MCK6067731.1 helix-turn-helix domain-containing protein [Microbacterium sp. EYE_512]QBR89356.1 AraC family transcriptional regulator [Microbacterium wangchenii]TXK11029.1 AraC family transcriptional regulator [Microbacterium wangchenii]
MADRTRGVLFPERLPRLDRVAPGDAVGAVSWFWVPQWDLPAGVVSRQPILAYPAANLVVQDGEARLWGATTRVGERVLQGRGWAVGALLRPAALAVLTDAPSALVDDSRRLDEPGLVRAVGAAMPDVPAACAVMAAWVADRVGPVEGERELANDMVDLLSSDPAVVRVEDAARRLRVSVRTVQRLAHRTVGLPPAAIIRRRRLQEAAARIREDPTVPLALVAADAGYADQAHLARDFRTVLGLTPSTYRRTRTPPARG